MRVSFLSGAKDYSRLFLEQRTDLLDVLSAFPSCQPLLPRLIGTDVHILLTTVLLMCMIILAIKSCSFVCYFRTLLQNCCQGYNRDIIQQQGAV